MLTHNLTTTTTHAICFDIDADHAYRLVTLLEATRAQASSPLHAAFLLADIALADLELFSTSTYGDFVSVREAMGTNLYALNAFRVARSPDLSDMPRRLTALANATASNSSSFKGVSGILDAIETFSKSTERDSVEAGRCSRAEADVFIDRVAFMRQIVDSALRRNEYIKDSVQALVQMVSLCNPRCSCSLV